MVKPAEEPRSWKDLLDPRWKGKILADDMRALGGGAVFFMVTYQTLRPRASTSKLAEQKPHMNRELRGNHRRVARGEYPIYIPFTIGDILDLKGLPVKSILPTEGAPYVLFQGTIFKGAPHPNAARLLMDFFLSDEVQLLYAAAGFVGVTGGLEARMTPEMRSFAQTKLLGTTGPEAPGGDAQDRQGDLRLARTMHERNTHAASGWRGGGRGDGSSDHRRLRTGHPWSRSHSWAAVSSSRGAGRAQPDPSPRPPPRHPLDHGSARSCIVRASGPAMPTVEVEEVSKRFGTVAAVDRVSLVVPDGRLVILLGPSGCGKTTTLRMIAGLEQNDRGPDRASASAW